MSLIRRPISPQIRVKAEPIDIADRLSRDTSPASSSDSDSDSDSDEPPELRSYQEEAVKAVLKAIKGGTRRIGVSAPTGGGKTIIFAFIIKEILRKHRKGKVLILVGTEEQAIQAKNKVLDAYGRERILIGEERNSLRALPRDEV
jgi:superfamily II DNA or RNA helicase